MSRPKLPYRIRQRPDNGYFQVKLADWSTWKSLYTKTPSEAKRKAAELYKAAAKEPSRGPSLEEFLAPYYITGKCPHIARVMSDDGRFSDAWAKDQRSRIERYVFTDEIAKVRVKELTAGHFEDLKARLRAQGIGPRTLNVTLGALKAALNEGVHRGQLPLNPAQPVSKVYEETTEMGIFEIPEIRLLLVERPDLWGTERGRSARAEARYGYLFAWLFYVLAYCTGERPSAVLRLLWREVNEGCTFTSTKTSRRSRTVPLPKFAQDAVREVRELGLRVGGNDPIFSYDDGSRMGKSWFEGRFRSMMKRGVLPAQDPDGRTRKAYSFKHSVITHLVDAGVDEVLVREYVGHSHGYGIRRTLTPVQARYKHRQLARLRAVADAIDEFLQSGMRAAHFTGGASVGESKNRLAEPDREDS